VGPPGRREGAEKTLVLKVLTDGGQPSIHLFVMRPEELVLKATHQNFSNCDSGTSEF
jgi:hypothetical protein